MKIPALPNSIGYPLGAFSRRMKAWWYGFEPLGIESPTPVADLPERSTEEVNEAAERAKAIQLIWGDGYLNPGGPDYLLLIFLPCAFDENSCIHKLILEVNKNLGSTYFNMPKI